MAPASSPAELARVAQPATIYNADFDRYFRVFREGPDIYQSEYQTDASGKVIFEARHRLEYVVGAGLNGYTYLVRRGNHLFEAPLSYYSKTGQWELSPGYGAADMGFTRPALAGCVACHNGQPNAVPNREALYRDPPFRFGEVAIGCEACHGPGTIHVRETREGRQPRFRGKHKHLDREPCQIAAPPGGRRLHELPPGRPHAHPAARKRLHGLPARHTAGPGFSDLQIAAGPGPAGGSGKAQTQAPVRGSLEMPSWWKNSSMQMSKCYQASNGRLRCVTCHKIHNPPTESTKAAFYRQKCLTCHTEKSCRLPVAQRTAESGADDCAACHMPKRPVGGIAHSESTNHRIMRRPGQPLPEIAFNEPTDLPGLVHINRSAESKTTSPLTLLAAYGEIMKRNPALARQYLALLDELSRSHPDDKLVLAALGRKALFDKEYEKAVEYLSKALERGSELTTTFLDLGDALSGAGRHREAAAVLERGIEASPYAPVLYKSLALEYITLKQYPRAHELIKRHVELFPEDSFMRGLLQKIETDRAAR